MRPSLDEFKRYMEKNSKRVGLRLLYRDFNIKDKDYRKKCRAAWDFIEECNANSKDDKCGEGDESPKETQAINVTKTKDSNSPEPKKKKRRGRPKKKKEKVKKEET